MFSANKLNAVSIGEINNNTNSTIPSFLSNYGHTDNTFYAYLKNGEELDLSVSLLQGYSVSKSVTVKIYDADNNLVFNSNAQTLNLNVTSSYTTTFTPPSEGVYSIVFTSPIQSSEALPQNSNINYTLNVKDSNDNIIDGRIWVDTLYLTQYTAKTVSGVTYDEPWFNTSLYTVGSSGYMYELDLYHYNGYSSSVLNFSSLGLVDSDGFPINKSIQTYGSGDGITLSESGVYHIFFEHPANDLPSSIKPEPFDDDGDIGNIINMTKTNSRKDYSGTINYYVDNAFVGPYEIQIDTDNNGSYTDANDVSIPLVANGGEENGSVSNPLQVVWDGKDGNGNTVAITQPINVRLKIDNASTFYVTLEDLERFGGLSITQLNGSDAGQSTVYWDDTLISGTAPLSSRPKDNLAGINSDVTSGVHGWETSGLGNNGYGNNSNTGSKIIETWINSSIGEKAIDNTKIRVQLASTTVNTPVDVPPLGDNVSDVSDGENGNTSGEITYTPDDNYSGHDTFTYTFTDENGNIIPVSVLVIVSPTGLNDSYTTNLNTPVTIDVLANDSGTDLSIDSVTNPSHGSVEIVDGEIVYTPNDNYSGTDTFTYTGIDSDGNTYTNTVTVIVLPKGLDDTDTTNVNTPVTLDVLANDSGTDLSIDSVTNPTHGSVEIVDGEIVYTPDDNYSGTDTFTYTGIDSDGNTYTNLVTITVLPKAVDDVTLVKENSSVTLNVTINDKGTKLIVTSIGTPHNGTVKINSDGTITYTPNKDFSGIDTFSYTVTDAEGNTTTATITITVLPEIGKVSTNKGKKTIVSELPKTGNDYLIITLLIEIIALSGLVISKKINDK
jgi:CshA-type fibril repeat protein